MIEVKKYSIFYKHSLEKTLMIYNEFKNSMLQYNHKIIYISSYYSHNYSFVVFYKVESVLYDMARVFKSSVFIQLPEYVL